MIWRATIESWLHRAARPFERSRASLGVPRLRVTNVCGLNRPAIQPGSATMPIHLAVLVVISPATTCLMELVVRRSVVRAEPPWCGHLQSRLHFIGPRNADGVVPEWSS